jgi:hypothetical protein
MTELLDGPEIVEVDESGNVIEPEAFKRKRGQVDTEEFSDELLEKCRDVGILESAIRAGGDYRQLKKHSIWWLPLQELLEFELKDIATDDDDEFFDWFDAFIDERQLQNKVDRTQKKTRSWSDWGPTTWSEGPQRISKWWSSWGYSSSGSSGSELTRRLAIALKAITTTVSVINDTPKRYHVKLAADTPDSPMSYTSYNEQLIAVSPQALLDTAMPEDDAIEISTGWALHEASHVKYSESLLDALMVPSALRPKSVAHLMHNLLEDLRIEDLTGKKFPGFAEYFTTANMYMWNATKHLAPTTWGPTLNDKTNAAIMIAKHPNEIKSIVDNDPGLTAEWPWWREWAENYVSDKEPIRQGIIRALEHLAEDEQTKQEMDDLAKQEQEFEQSQPLPLTDDQFRELLKQLKELLDQGGETIDPCPSPSTAGTPVTLTDEQASELEQLISEEYQQFEAHYKMREGTASVGPTIEVMKPIEDDYSRRYYRRPGGMAERLREAFFFRKTDIAETERLLKSGFVDEEELWRAGTGDTRVFERAAEPDEQSVSVTMLTDVSGSMIGSGLEKAQELATVMMACLRTQRGVRTRVRAHTTGYIGGGLHRGQETSKVFRIWDPGDPDTRLGLLTTVEHGANFDGFAIDWCAKELSDTAQTNEQLLLIVLSDGLPNGTIEHNGSFYHYGGESAMKHMRELGDYWDRQGVKIVQIAIDSDIRPDDQAKMFKNWIGYTTDSKLLVDLTKLLIKTFGGVD